ncbi:hypothetical protein ACTXT7_010014 [Hymenolepis weldensis]
MIRNQPTDVRVSQSQDASVAENVTIINTAPFEGVAAGTATKMATKKASTYQTLIIQPMNKKNLFQLITFGPTKGAMFLTV